MASLAQRIRRYATTYRFQVRHLTLGESWDSHRKGRRLPLSIKVTAIYGQHHICMSIDSIQEYVL